MGLFLVLDRYSALAPAAWPKASSIPQGKSSTGRILMRT